MEVILLLVGSRLNYWNNYRNILSRRSGCFSNLRFVCSGPHHEVLTCYVFPLVQLVFVQTSKTQQNAELKSLEKVSGENISDLKSLPSVAGRTS